VARVLVIGGMGLLGQYVAREGRRRGHEVLATHRGRRPPSDGTSWQPLDLAEPGAAAEVVRDASPDLVVNAAALTDVDGCETRTDEARLVNAEAAGALAEASGAIGAGFVHASTDYVFDGTGPATEETPASPLNAYGRSKLEGERLVARGRPDALVLRLSAVFGDNRLSTKPNAVTWILERLLRGEEARLFEDQRLTPTYAQTAAECAFDLWAARARGLFNVASRDCLSRVEMGRIVAEVFRIPEARIVPVPLSSVALKAPRPPAPCLVVRKVEETLKRDMPGFRACVEHMRAAR